MAAATSASSSGWNDDRDRRGRVLGGKGCGRRDRYDQVSLESNHLDCKFLESLCPALRISAFNDDVLPLYVPEFPEALEQYFINVLLCL